MSPRGAPAPGRCWHRAPGPQRGSSPRPNSGSPAPPRISQCRLGCWKPSPFPQPTPVAQPGRRTRPLPESGYGSSRSPQAQPSPSPALWGKQLDLGAGDSGGVGQGRRAGGRGEPEPQGGRRRGWKGREERAESAVLIPASVRPSVQPPGAAEDAPVADGLWAPSGAEPHTRLLRGCRREAVSGGGDTENRSSVHTGP